MPAKKSFDAAKDNKGLGAGADTRRFVSNPCRHCGERYFAGDRCRPQQRFKCLEVDEEAEMEFTEEEKED